MSVRREAQSSDFVCQCQNSGTAVAWFSLAAVVKEGLRERSDPQPTREDLMTTTLAPEQNLADTMAKLENALLSPLVSGELSGWVHTVQEAAATLAVDVASYLRTVLHVQYDEIAQADSEMSAHVEKLLVGDQQLLEQMTGFHEELHKLAAAAEHVQKNEGKLAELRKRVEDNGLALILGIKKQQAAATTWLAEAHYRDRGVGD
jgi:hypothetical protein